MNIEKQLYYKVIKFIKRKIEEDETPHIKRNTDGYFIASKSSDGYIYIKATSLFYDNSCEIILEPNVFIEIVIKYNEEKISDDYKISIGLKFGNLVTTDYPFIESIKQYLLDRIEEDLMETFTEILKVLGKRINNLLCTPMTTIPAKRST